MVQTEHGLRVVQYASTFLVCLFPPHSLSPDKYVIHQATKKYKLSVQMAVVLPVISYNLFICSYRVLDRGSSNVTFSQFLDCPILVFMNSRRESFLAGDGHDLEDPILPRMHPWPITIILTLCLIRLKHQKHLDSVRKRTWLVIQPFKCSLCYELGSWEKHRYDMYLWFLEMAHHFCDVAVLWAC